jgi:site-specific recombinase XerD
MLENGVNIGVVQELMGHANVKTTDIYSHVMEKDFPLLQDRSTACTRPIPENPLSSYD